MNWFGYAILSAIFSAFAALSQKVVLRKTDAVSFSFALAFFNALFVAFYMAVFGAPELSFDETLILAGKTLLGAAAFLCVMISIESFELSSVLPVLAFTPALVAVAAFLILGETLALPEIFGLALMLVGFYVLETRERQLLMPLKTLFESRNKYVLFALLLFTVSSVIDKLLIGRYKVNPLDFVVAQQLFAFPVFGAVFLFYKRKRKEAGKNFSVKLVMWIVGILALTLLYRFLYIKSLQFGAVALALTVKRFSVFFAVILSGRLLNEKNILRKAAATVLIIAGAYFILS